MAPFQQQSRKTPAATAAAPQSPASQQQPKDGQLAAADRWYSEKRLGGLSRFALAITILNIIGHAFLGFEQSWLTPFVALAATYGTELVGETIEAYCHGRPTRYRGSVLDLVKFLLPAHISGLAVGMLLYAAENVAAVAFAGSVAMASKYIFRVTIGTDRGGKSVVRHVLNPSNLGITVTLLLFPTVSIAPPYQFTENTWGIVDWILPLIIICTGSYLNIKATGRIPLIVAWVIAFATQAVLRAAVNGFPVWGELLPMTGFAFVLFTFYMITDPATSPAKKSSQIGFAAAVAVAYALFMELHVVFGLFFALTLVTGVRGLWIVLAGRRHATTLSLPARPTITMTPAE
jgi:enediyne biosynthesis protein E5